jgi:hypothetical protein
MNLNDFKKKFQEAKTIKQVNWETLYRNTMELFCPHRENFYNRQSGEKKGRNVWSSSPYIALEKSANNMHSVMTPHQRRWVNLRAGRLIPDDQKEKANQDLQEITNTLFDHINASNFDLAVSEFYKDLNIGTGAILVNGTEKNPLMFTTIPLHELFILPGEMNTVDTVFRKYKIAHRNIEKTWEDAKIGVDLAEAIKSNPDKEIEVIEGTVPKKVKMFNIKTGREEEIDGYGYYVCIEGSSNGYIVERDMPINPWIVVRWSLFSGDVWGRGPAIICYDDAQTLNEFIKLHMQSMQLNVHKVYTIVDDGVINVQNIKIKPGVFLPVSANDGAFGPTIKSLDSGTNLQASQIEVQRLEASINDQLYTEALGPITLPVKTATEISIRQQELAKRIGSAYGRFQYEFTKQFVNICLYQLDKFNIISMNDFKVDGHNIAIEAVSPLAQSQQQEDINNMTRLIEFAMGVFGPDITMSEIKPAEVLKFIGDGLNVSSGIFMSEEDKLEAMSKMKQLMEAVPEQQQASPQVQ